MVREPVKGKVEEGVKVAEWRWEDWNTLLRGTSGVVGMVYLINTRNKGRFPMTSVRFPQ